MDERGHRNHTKSNKRKGGRVEGETASTNLGT